MVGTQTGSLTLEQRWVPAGGGDEREASECYAFHRLQQTLTEDLEEIKCLRTLCLSQPAGYAGNAGYQVCRPPNANTA